MNMTRRELIATLAAGATLAAESRSAKPLLGFKQYGMKKIPVRQAIRHIASIGYKSLSLSLMPGWDTEPRLLGTTDRTEIRSLIADLGLTLATVQESVRLLGPN